MNKAKSKDSKKESLSKETEKIKQNAPKKEIDIINGNGSK